MNPVIPRRRLVRFVLKRILIHTLWLTGLLALAKWWVQRRGVVVLTFHRVLRREGWLKTTTQKGMIVTDESFRQLLQYLKKKDYSTISLNDDIQLNAQKRIRLALTFDDGWEDNASIAFPIARECNTPLTVFICPGLVGQSLAFWPDQVSLLVRSNELTTTGIEKVCNALTKVGYPEWAADLRQVPAGTDRANLLIENLKTLTDANRSKVLELMLEGEVTSGVPVDLQLDRTMSWSQVGLLNEAGVTFGSHTQLHKILTQIPLSDAEEEISWSRDAIRKNLSKDCSLFSYPNGDASPEARDLVARAGFRWAFINSPGVWRREGDQFLIPRINICETHLTDSKGRFSPLAFEYSVFWRAFIHGHNSRTQAQRTVFDEDNVTTVMT